MTLISKNVYIDKLDDIVNEYNNTCHSTIKMKPLDVKSSTYINFDAEKNDEDPKFKVSDHVRISKYKNIFAKGDTRNSSEEVFMIKKVKNTVPTLTEKKLLEHFMRKNCKRQIKQSLEMKK